MGKRRKRSNKKTPAKKVNNTVGTSLADKLSGVNPTPTAPSGPTPVKASPPPKKKSREIPEVEGFSLDEMGMMLGMEPTKEYGEEVDEGWEDWLDGVEKLSPKKSRGAPREKELRPVTTSQYKKHAEQLEKDIQTVVGKAKEQDKALREVIAAQKEAIEDLERGKEALLAEQEDWKLRCAELEEIPKERERSERFLEERDEARRQRDEALEKANNPTLEQLFSWRGIPDHRHQEALSALALSSTSSLLSLLKGEAEALEAILQKELALCCSEHDCIVELQSASSTRALLRVSEPQACENCGGSDNRRAYHKMLRYLRKHRHYRIVIVGGSPDAFTELQQLTPKGFDLKLVNGKDRRNKQQATDDLRYSDLVIIWGPTILPHKISELYTKQKEDFPGRLLLVQRRGITSLAQEVCDFLGAAQK